MAYANEMCTTLNKFKQFSDVENWDGYKTHWEEVLKN